MTTAQFKQIAFSKFNKLSTNELMKSANELMKDYRHGADEMMNVCLDILETRLPEDEFIKFCDSI